MKTELLVLKSKLCGLEISSRRFRRRIAKLKGMKRWTLRHRKLALGAYTREHLIAYGLLRNVPYERIEAKCAKGNEPNIDRVVDIVQSHVPHWERLKWSRDRVRELLRRAGGEK